MALDWKTVELKDLVDPERGISYGIVQPGKPAANGVPIVRVGDVRDGRISTAEPLRVSTSVEANYSRTRLRGGELLLTLVGTIGESAVVPDSLEGWNTARAVAVIPVRPEVGSYWVKLALKAPAVRQLIDSRLNTTVQATLNLRDVAKLPIVLPPLPQRRAIAHILGTLDDKIELNRRMSETLEAMARALFKSWFVDFDPVRAKQEGRWRPGQSLPGLPAHLYDLFPSRLVDSELGQIPEDWQVEALGNAVNMVKGRSYKSSELAASETALVTLKSFERGGGYRADGLKPFTGTYKPDQIIEPGDIVLACTDVTQAAEVIGRPAMVLPSPRYQRLVASLDTMILRPNDDRTSRTFLYLLCGTEAFTNHTYAHTTGTTVLHLAKKAVPSFQFALPSRKMMLTLDKHVAPAFLRDQGLEQENEVLSSTRDSLLPKLISGEIRVNDQENFIERAAP